MQGTDDGAAMAIARRILEDHGPAAEGRAMKRLQEFSESGDAEAAQLWRRVVAALGFWATTRRGGASLH